MRRRYGTEEVAVEFEVGGVAALVVLVVLVVLVGVFGVFGVFDASGEEFEAGRDCSGGTVNVLTSRDRCCRISAIFSNFSKVDICAICLTRFANFGDLTHARRKRSSAEKPHS